MRPPTLTILGLAGTMIVATAHALLHLGADMMRRVVDEDTGQRGPGPLGPREP